MHLLPLLALSFISSASSRTLEFTTRHVLHAVPTGWEAVAPAPADHLIDMRIGLKQARMDDLLAILAQVSDPGHVRYGMHLSKAEVDELVAPRSETVETVEEWLDAHGVKISGRSSAGDWLHVRVPVARAEKMLNTRYNVYQHESGSHIVRSESYALPRWLDDHVDLVQPTTFFGKLHERGSGVEKRMWGEDLMAVKPTLSCNSTITPACLRTLYRTKDYVPSATKRNSLGITGYLGQYASRADLRTFYKKYRPDGKTPTFSVELVNGGLNNETAPGFEANLDTQPYLEWVNYMLAKDKLPWTISTSYGESGEPFILNSGPDSMIDADLEQTVPYDYAKRVCNSFAQLGARGVSLLFASGDSGVGGGSCLSNTPPSRKQFQPLFPATCPYVTSVGATYGVSPEIALLLSQGGFSNYFSRPSYQDKAVSAYVKSLGRTYDGLYNRTGRGFPDVSAQGRSYLFVHKGKAAPITGTSAACPTFAGVITLLNDYRLSKGKKPLGFLNPWLYKNPGMLNDITLGHSAGCGTNGFNATAGWDPVTGLGTPDFVKMQSKV
ncbi:hypothetical protein FRC10_005084 [Ceratobasidium sp. 414]|nr:hypothetical protein FRC10_005084 [Ceratobasidium sp. 414]